MIVAYAILIGLCLITIAAFVHANSKRESAEDLQASNARVLREYKRIALYQPDKIIDNPRRMK